MHLSPSADGITDLCSNLDYLDYIRAHQTTIHEFKSKIANLNKEQLEVYDLGYNAKGKLQNKVGRDILFIERNLKFLKPGGRMAVVLPQGRFNNSSDKFIRDYIAERSRILAVVGLHGNVFKPHTGTKTSVLFVQK